MGSRSAAAPAALDARADDGTRAQTPMHAIIAQRTAAERNREHVSRCALAFALAAAAAIALAALPAKATVAAVAGPRVTFAHAAAAGITIPRAPVHAAKESYVDGPAYAIVDGGRVFRLELSRRGVSRIVTDDPSTGAPKTLFTSAGSNSVLSMRAGAGRLAVAEARQNGDRTLTYTSAIYVVSPSTGAATPLATASYKVGRRVDRGGFLMLNEITDQGEVIFTRFERGSPANPFNGPTGKRDVSTITGYAPYGTQREHARVEQPAAGYFSARLLLDASVAGGRVLFATLRHVTLTDTATGVITRYRRSNGGFKLLQAALHPSGAVLYSEFDLAGRKRDFDSRLWLVPPVDPGGLSTPIVPARPPAQPTAIAIHRTRGRLIFPRFCGDRIVELVSMSSNPRARDRMLLRDVRGAIIRTMMKSARGTSLEAFDCDANSVVVAVSRRRGKGTIRTLPIS